MVVQLKPSYKQYEIWKLVNPEFKIYDEFGISVEKEILFGGAAGGGKTWMGCEWLYYMAKKYPGTRWFIARNELKRIMQSTVVTWRKMCSHHGIPKTEWKLNGQWNYIELKNGSRIDLIDVKYKPSDPLFEDLGSIEYTGGFFEEIGEITLLAYETLMSRCGRFYNDHYGIPKTILATCNPKQGWQKERFFDPWTAGKLPFNRFFIQALAKDNPKIDRGYIRSLEQLSDPIQKARLLYGDWNYESNPYCIFELFTINNLTLNTHVPTGTKYITVDPAGTGKDFSIITIWDGWRVVRIIRSPEKNLPKLQALIESEALEYGVKRANVIVEQDGLGVGLVQYGKFTGAIAGSGARGAGKKIYMNLRAQMYFEISKVLNENNIYIDPDKVSADDIAELKKDLHHIKKGGVDDDEKKLHIIKRKDIIQELGRSPDWSSSFYLRVFPEIKGVIRSHSGAEHGIY